MLRVAAVWGQVLVRICWFGVQIPPARMTVMSRKETHFVDISIVNLIVGWR